MVTTAPPLRIAALNSVAAEGQNDNQEEKCISIHCLLLSEEQSVSI